MSEEKQITVLVIAVALIGITGLYLTGGLNSSGSACILGCGDVYVESYRADLYLDGKLEKNLFTR